ncbi:MAG: pantetheine-phosphate adenylyltransferase [Candidatus Magasanikbacteria bacterium]|nr:pantetheine-phosphate adenylyltransferase [Candidatus Magasanikbacteria bacterium]
MSRVAVYAGTFDPFTNGHAWVVETGAKLFDTVIIAVGVNPGKTPRFSVEDRIDLIRMCTAHLSNVRITSYSNQYTISHAREMGAAYLLRGIRSLGDYEYESKTLNTNRVIGDDIETVFLMPPLAIAGIESSVVRGLVGPSGWEEVIAKFVPPAVLAKFKEVSHG